VPRVVVLIALSCYLASIPSVAAADPITVTGGSLTTSGVFGPVDFTLTGQGFSAHGGGEPGFAGPSLCTPCVTGNLVDFNGTFAGEFTLGSGPATVNGVSYPNVFYTGSLEFEAPGVTFPGGSSTVTLTSPFMLATPPGSASSLQGFLDASLQGPPVFNVALTGAGVATAIYTEGPAGLFNFSHVTYAFSPAAVPEPSSVLLLATGLLSAGLRSRWVRRRKL
jgi:hypothetical protein